MSSYFNHLLRYVACHTMYVINSDSFVFVIWIKHYIREI
jgi:hypothetical protein